MKTTTMCVEEIFPIVAKAKEFAKQLLNDEISDKNAVMTIRVD